MQSLNLTGPRRAVLDVVRTSTDHPTATDIMDRLAQQGNRVAYATVYNSLKYLTEKGMIRELNIGNGVMRYDGRMEEHGHLICTRCGAIAESAADIPDTVIETIEAETGYKVHDMNLLLTGLCPSCRNDVQSH